MRRSMRVGSAAAVAALVLVAAGAVGFAQDKSAVLKERQDFMKAQGNDVKAITAFAKGEGDQAAALTAADDLAAKAPKIVALFPDGTSTTDFPGKTAAKPEIWSNFDKFKAIPVTLESEDAKLVDAIKSGDPKAAQAQLGVVGKTCGSCHGDFRVKQS